MGFTKLYLLILFIDRLWLTILRLMFPRYQIGFRSGAKKHLSDTECTTFRSWAKQHLSVAIIPLKIAFLKGTDRCFFTSESYPVQCKSYTRISMYKTFSELNHQCTSASLPFTSTVFRYASLADHHSHKFFIYQFWLHRSLKYRFYFPLR